MRPLNSKQRRIQFLRFLLLFAVAILPVVLLVHQDNQLDRVMNESLVKRVKAGEETETASAKGLAQMERVAMAFDALDNFVLDKAQEITENRMDLSASIEKYVVGIEEWPMDESGADTTANKATRKIVGSAKSTIKQLYLAHKQGYSDREDLKRRDLCVEAMTRAISDQQVLLPPIPQCNSR